MQTNKILVSSILLAGLILNFSILLTHDKQGEASKDFSLNDDAKVFTKSEIDSVRLTIYSNIDDYYTLDLENIFQSTEGNVVNVHYKNDILYYIKTYIYSEMFRSTEEYFFLNNRLVYFRCKNLNYEVPIYGIDDFDKNYIKSKDLYEYYKLSESDVIAYLNGKINSNEETNKNLNLLIEGLFLIVSELNKKYDKDFKIIN